MDKYHIYEELGKGEFSQIYKVCGIYNRSPPFLYSFSQGREKKSIEYVAIKRVDKNMMTNVCITKTCALLIVNTYLDCQ
jgi:hypothetical protein